nr:ABC transporter ATP-binding protein [Kineococcus rhizosphaerae]
MRTATPGVPVPQPQPTPTRPPQTAAAVQLDAVTKHFPNGPDVTVALDAVTLTIAPGTFTAVMGPSGSGKSTFLNCAAGLERPTSGTVRIAGRDLGALRPDDVTRVRRDHVGFVFQGYDLVPHLTVAENVALPVTLAGRHVAAGRVRSLLGSVGLDGLQRRLPAELSGGQAQRVAIARALVTEPDVVFADEPTGALDVRAAEQVLTLLRSAVDDLGRTLVLVTHDPRAAERADEVVFLADGRVQDRLPRSGAHEIASRLLDLGR